MSLPVDSSSIEYIEDPDWVYSTITEDRLKQIKRDGIRSFISQWINMTTLILFVLTNDGYAFGSMPVIEFILYIVILCMANWTGTTAVTKFWYYSKVLKAKRRYAIKYGLIPWWKQKEFGGWK